MIQQITSDLQAHSFRVQHLLGGSPDDDLVLATR
jgi:hypothetical protein